MFKAFRDLIKTSTRTVKFEKCLRSTRTLLSPSAYLNRQEIQMLVDAFLCNSASSEVSVKLLASELASAKDWVVHLKAITLLLCILRKSKCEHLQTYLSEYLSTCRALQQTLPSTTKAATTESISNQVYNQILLNLKSYAMKICYDMDTYQSLWGSRECWKEPPACLLFKAVNTCNYLLATKSMFSKLFKEFDPSELFHELFRFVLEELAMWLEFIASRLHHLLDNSRQFEPDELQSLEQLCEQAKKVYSRTSLMTRMVDIHAIPIQVPHLRSIRVPFEFKLSVEKCRTGSDSTKAGSFVKRVLQIDSLDRSFKEDDMNKSQVCSRSRKRNQPRSSVHTSLLMTRSFVEEL